MMQDTTIDGDHHVRVTRSVLTINGHNYPVAGITAFRTICVAANDSSQMVGVAVSGTFSLIGFAMLFSFEPASMLGGLLLIGICAGIIVLCVRSARGLRPSYTLVLSTAGGDVHALRASELVDIERVSGALTEALAARYS
jgi:hypothetical protein